MYRVCLFGFLLFLATPAWAEIVDSSVFINEFHYDNVGADENEFVEVVAPESWTDLAGVTLTLYNGANGASYAGPTGLDKFARRGAVDGFVFYTLDIAMQNGAPDGMALAWGSQVLQFISYEGSFTATNGVATGLLSTDIGVFEEADTPLGYSLQLAGSGDSYADFTWQPAAPHTYGMANLGQSFVVPEPATAGMWCAVLGLLAGVRRRYPRVVRG
jgi:uncharacterized protein